LFCIVDGKLFGNVDVVVERVVVVVRIVVCCKGISVRLVGMCDCVKSSIGKHNCGRLSL
jgi:hypothetical protein